MKKGEVFLQCFDISFHLQNTPINLLMVSSDIIKPFFFNYCYPERSDNKGFMANSGTIGLSFTIHIFFNLPRPDKSSTVFVCEYLFTHSRRPWPFSYNGWPGRGTFGVCRMCTEEHSFKLGSVCSNHWEKIFLTRKLEEKLMLFKMHYRYRFVLFSLIFIFINFVLKLKK